MRKKDTSPDVQNIVISACLCLRLQVHTLLRVTHDKVLQAEESEGLEGARRYIWLTEFL